MDEDPRFPLYIRWNDVSALLKSLPVVEQLTHVRMIFPCEELDDHVLDVLLPQAPGAVRKASEDMFVGSPMDDQEAHLAVAAAVAFVENAEPVPDRLDQHLGVALSCQRSRLTEAATSIVAGLPEAQRLRILAQACDQCWVDIVDLEGRFDPREVGRAVLALLDAEAANPARDRLDGLAKDFGAIDQAAFLEVAKEALRGKVSAKRARLVLLGAQAQPPSQALDALLAPLDGHGSKAVKRLAAARTRWADVPAERDSERARAFARLEAAGAGVTDPDDLPPVAAAYAHARKPGYAPNQWSYKIGDALAERPRPADLLWAAVAGVWFWHDDQPRDLDEFVRQLVKVPGIKAALPGLLDEDLVAWKNGILLEVLGRVGGATTDTWLACLDHGTKRARDLAVAKLRETDADLTTGLVNTVRTASARGREAAISLFDKHSPDAGVLRELISSERSDRLRIQLERSLSARSPQASPDNAESALLARLDGTKARKRPKWVGTLPPLSLASGRRLDAKQVDALITLLRAESPDAHDPSLMALRGAFGPSAAAWSRAVFEAWAPYLHLPGRTPPKQPRGVQYDATATGPSGQKWAVFQQSFFADDDQVEAFGRFLVGWGNANWRFGTWCVVWLERHASPVADDALAREVLLGPYGKSREAAVAALQRRATAHGRTLEEQLTASSFVQVGRGELPVAAKGGKPKDHLAALVAALEAMMGGGQWLPVEEVLALPHELLEGVVFLHDGVGVRRQGDEWLDAAGEGVAIPPQAPIGVAHAAELGPTATDGFATQLADYQHIAMFPQLARPPVAPESLAPRTDVFQVALHRHLKGRGYQVHGRTWVARRALPRRRAVLELTWDMDPHGMGNVIVIGAVRQLTGEGGCADPVAMSEMAYDLQRLPGR